MVKHYITFGYNHTYIVNGAVCLDSDCVAVVELPDEDRSPIFKMFGQYFSHSTTKLENADLDFYPRGLIAVTAKADFVSVPVRIKDSIRDKHGCEPFHELIYSIHLYPMLEAYKLGAEYG